MSNTSSRASRRNANVYDHEHEYTMTKDCLKQQGYSNGLAQALMDSVSKSPLRIWIVDDSGSMNTDDGYRILETRHRNHVKIAKCTRWDELKECVAYHAELAGLLRAPTQFRLLNGLDQMMDFTVASANGSERSLIDSEVNRAKEVMRKCRPRGVTPLTERILQIHDSLKAILRSTAPGGMSGENIGVFIATDGIPTDDRGYSGQMITDQFIASIRSLQRLCPSIWIVIRLCTSDESVVRFYNSLDALLELQIEVLDDFLEEAKQVATYNPWLNYTLPLHRCREFGFHDDLMDLLDERPITRSELVQFCHLLFGEENCAEGRLPDPDLDWRGFTNRLVELLKFEEKQWNPMRKKPTPWVDVGKLNHAYGEDGSPWSASGHFCSWEELACFAILIAVLARFLLDGVIF